MTHLSLEYYEVCKTAVDGRYEADDFNRVTDQVFRTLHQRQSVGYVPWQDINNKFVEKVRTVGHKHHFKDLENNGADIDDTPEDVWYNEINTADADVSYDEKPAKPAFSTPSTKTPTKLTHSQALDWVSQVFVRTRGRELFNPLLVGELL